MESPTDTDTEPSPLIPVPHLDVRWVHAGAQHLDLLPTPITSASKTYKAFSYRESQKIDTAWQSLSPSEQVRAIAVWGRTDGEGALPSVKNPSKEKTSRQDNKGKEKVSRKNRSSTVNKEQDVHPIDAKVQSERTNDSLSSEDDETSSDEARLDDQYKEFISHAQQDQDGLDVVQGVPVSQDSLFEVSLLTLSLHPVFWAHTGPRVAVIRGTWFAEDKAKPCCWELAEELERAYLAIQPWQPSYKLELSTALSLGSTGEEKLKYNLPSKFGQDLGIIFEDENKGRLISSGTLNYLARTLWSSLRAKPSGTFVYRGYDAASAASGGNTFSPHTAVDRKVPPSHSKRSSISSKNSNKSEDTPTTVGGRPLGIGPREPLESIVGNSAENKLMNAAEVVQDVNDGLRILRDQKIGEGTGALDPEQAADHREAREEENAPVTHDTEDDEACTDLILVVHGIGQQLALQYEAYNFVYAGNQLRHALRKQSVNPALASIMRDRRCQILPVQWRASLDLEDQTSAEDAQHAMDNRFTIADITLNQSIPYVRELTNAVLLDIPLFMSHHRQKMIEAVCIQANRLFRLWIARHPDFEKHGRLHIIGHSLGSALVAHILSNQPTKMPRLSQLPKQVIIQTKDRFLFNTSNLFLVGSPLGIFLHIDQAQIMPRKGRERTMHSPQDEALDRAGRFGCMAIDSLYNVFYHTDPIAYQLNAALDSKIASQRQPLAITSVTAPFYAPVTDSISSISKYLPAVLGGSSNKSTRPGVIRLPSGIEMSGPNGEEQLEGSRGERRFSAMNPHGNIDFFLPSAGVSEYLDSVTAHLSYWTDPSFVAFLLAEIFSTRLDLMRTGMGLAGSGAQGSDHSDI